MVRKTCVGAFSATDLDQQLEDRAITTLILAGVNSSGVLLSTVREAADRDYRIYFLLMQAHLITVADLPGLIVTVGRPVVATNTATKVRT
jgi:nicotinamidase-related amidase